MTEHLKNKIIFDEPHQDEAIEQDLTLQQHFSEGDDFQIQPIEEETVERQLEHSLSRPKKKRRGLKALLLAGLGLAGWQTVDHVVTAYQSADWLQLGWAGFVAGLALFGAGALLREAWRLRQLRQRQSEREQAADILAADGIGHGRPFCQRLAKQTGINSEHAGYERWLHALATSHNDSEVLALYDHMVVSQQDKQAQALVARYAKEAALMVAISPLAIADMLLVAWRNFRLIDQVAKVYGVELGYWCRIQLLRLVLANMAVAGATELVADVGMDLLSVDLAGRMSTRVAQGLGIGLLTGRLGLKAISLMRPLPWQPDQQPKLSDVRKALLASLTAPIKR